MAQKMTYPPNEVVRCLLALQEELTKVLKVLSDRDEEVTIEVPGRRWSDKAHVGYPCKPDPTGDRSRQLIADVFIAVSKAVLPGRKRRK